MLTRPVIVLHIQLLPLQVMVVLAREAPLRGSHVSHYYSIAGLDDPFLATVITNAVQLAVILVVVGAVDKLGRRNICCSGLTILWLSNIGVGILGLVKTNKATSSLLVTFSCIWG